MKVTTVQLSLITGMMLGFEYVAPDVHPDEAHGLVIDLLFFRILIQHGEVEGFE